MSDCPVGDVNHARRSHVLGPVSWLLCGCVWIPVKRVVWRSSFPLRSGDDKGLYVDAVVKKVSRWYCWIESYGQYFAEECGSQSTDSAAAVCSLTETCGPS